MADEKNRWKQDRWTSTTWLDTLVATSVDAFVGGFMGAFVGVLEGLETGKSTLVDPVVGALVGPLVGAFVGPLVGPLVVPPMGLIVGRGSLSPALCVAHSSVSRRRGCNKGGRKQMRANANKHRQTLTNASKRRGENARKRKQTRANVDKRKQTLTPPFIAVFYTPLCNPLNSGEMLLFSPKHGECFGSCANLLIPDSGLPLKSGTGTSFPTYVCMYVPMYVCAYIYMCWRVIRLSTFWPFESY